MHSFHLHLGDMKILLAALLLGISSGCFGQTAELSVRVLTDQKLPISNATAELYRIEDSSVVKTEVTDNNGVALFQNIREGNYFLKLTSVGFAPTYSGGIQVLAGQTDFSLAPIVMDKTNTTLKEVIVDGKKPFIQKLSDRLVVNVENSIVNAGNTAFEVLERSPGVNIDQNDVIRMRGKQGVIIMIDGKTTAMNGTDLINYLKSLPSASLERIDLITNPSAKYDATGTAGIIDIRMKKDQRLGANGSFTASYGQGKYPKASAGNTFNYRDKRVNVFGNYNYAYRVFRNHLFLDRSFYENGIYNGGDLKDNSSKIPINGNTARIGADFFAGKKTTIGFVVNANFHHVKRTAVNSSQVINPQKNFESTFTSTASNNDRASNVVSNINFRHTFDSLGKELTADLDYGSYPSSSITRNTTQYYKLDGSSLQPNYILDGDQQGKLRFQTAKLDFSNPMKKRLKFETGFKLSFVSSDNDAKFFDVSSGSPKNDTSKTNHFIYKENNNAGYIIVSKEFKHFNLQAGLRGEHTNFRTNQKIGSLTFDSSYFQLFPSAFFNYKLKEDQTLGLSVSRRIDRPGYGDLNPFLFLIDVTTYATGNTRLLPQLTWAYELSYTLKSLNFSLSYSHTTNQQNITLARFTEVFPNIPSPENVTVQIPINLSSSDYFGVSVSAPVKISKWWNMVNNGNLYYQKFNGHFSGTFLNAGKPVADVRSNNSFTLGKGWQAELNGSLNTGGQYGFMVMNRQWALDLGLQKSLLKKKGQLRLSVTDIFYTNLPRAVVTFDNYVEKWHALRESRVATLTFNYKFGRSSVQGSKRRTTGSEEERQRAG